MRVPDLPIPFDPVATTPRYRQVADGIRAAILDGRLRPGARLPGTRALADQLGVVRNVVAEAYGALAGEGYVEARYGSGTYVSVALPYDLGQPAAVVASGAAPEPGVAGRAVAPNHDSTVHAALTITSITTAGRPLARLVARLRAEEAAVPMPIIPSRRYDLRPGVPATDLFPRPVWRTLVAEAAVAGGAQAAGGSLAYDDPLGYTPLREQIAAYLSRARAVRCRPEHVLVTSGAQQALDLIGRLVLDPGDPVAIEDPAYLGARRALVAAGGHPCPVPVDAEGLDVTALTELSAREPVRLVYVTPAHQFPTGAVMSPRRRLALVGWAAAAGAWIVEDDYDGELRYAGRPLSALHGLDPSGRTIYVGTFSTVLDPRIHVGYAVLPPDLVEPATRLTWAADRHAPTLLHAALARFIGEGHFERHLRRARRAYRRRQEALAGASRAGLGDDARVETANAGMHLVVHLSALVAGARAVHRAAELDVAVYPLSPCYQAPQRQPGLVLGYAALTEHQLVEAARRLVDALRL